MGLSNEELVQKAVVTTDALAAAGKLNPAQSDKFIDYIVDETMLKNNARTVRFRNETLDIDKIGIGSRVAMPKAEAQDPSLRRGVNTSKISLTPKEIIVPFEIGDNFKEINIEGDASEDHIIKMMARQLANDLEELYLNGDTLGAAVLEGDIIGGGSSSQVIKDSYLGLDSGWARRADSGAVYDAAGASIGLTVFGAMLRQMPTKFRRNKKSLRFYLSPDLSQVYVEKLAARATALGDQATSGIQHTPFGVSIAEVPLWPFTPRIVEHVAVTTPGNPVALRYKPIANEVVTESTLGATPTTPYVDGVDYTINLANGTIDANGVTNTTLKVTYDANPQVLLTHEQNFIVGIGRDIRIEKDRDIFKGVNQYAITAKVAVQIEETTAIVKGINVAQS
ncbi:MAG: hypothetical protein ACE5FA_09770 [Dehalococcoidia bacterium]